MDNYGNQKTFENAVQFTLVDEIYVFAKPTRAQIVPGTAVHLIGEAKTILQADIDEGNVVEVSGYSSGTGVILATRIEVKNTQYNPGEKSMLSFFSAFPVKSLCPSGQSPR